jgi:ABC-type sulfate transport system substrate-binding protein
MDRGLIVGAVAFAAAFGLERLYVSLGPDIARYESLRKMSGQKPILKELMSAVTGAMGDGVSTDGAKGIVAGLTADVVRYARMRGM